MAKAVTMGTRTKPKHKRIIASAWPERGTKEHERWARESVGARNPYLLCHKWHNVPKAYFRLGTRYLLTCPATGRVVSRFIYLRLAKRLKSPGVLPRGLVVPLTGRTYVVTNDPDHAILPTVIFAIAISPMCAGWAGWFWCGGECPVDLIPELAGGPETEEDLCLKTATWA